MTVPREVLHKAGLRCFMIGDVRGYTRFTAEHGDEAAAHLAATFAMLAREAVEARGGRVIELRGDEVLAVFDDAAQSVRAARELQWTCAEEVAEDPSLPLLVGIGIAAGEAVPVEEGFRGAALNLAARLCSTAAAGEVLVSAWLAELATPIDGVSFGDRGEVQLKGFPQPVPFLEVSGARPQPPPAHDEAAPPSGLPAELDTGLPLVAREHEIRWARGTWRQARRGAGRVLFVSGPSGIGKTRLAAEIAAGVEADGAAVYYAGAGGTAIADTLAAIERAHGAMSPTLVILDDFDVAGERAATALAQVLDSIRDRRTMVLALVQRTDASASLAALVEVVDVLGDGHRALSPLDLDGVREVCRVYAGDDVAEAPVESIARASGGVPGQVHEAMSEWARGEATRRLEAAAEWLSVGRERRAMDLGFANNIIGLKLDRIYRVPDHVETSGGSPEGPPCPYKGLASFGSEDAAFFFGRESLVGELAARTVGVGLLGVVGASGSGKSSVVAAGLRSSLAAGLLPGSARWEQVSMRPGRHPMAALRRALRAEDAATGSDTAVETSALLESVRRDGRLVLYVDQFEEVFTTSEDPDGSEAFVDVLTEMAAHGDRVAIVLALRGDFYAHTAKYPVLAHLLSENHVLVGPMSPDELRRAIELPARRAGVHVESSLADRLIEEVGEAPGGLPLLSTALMELWDQREDGWLRLEAYERTGGLRGAVARLAEQSYAELDDAQKEAAPSVFLRLVGPGEGDAVTRRRVPLDEFDAGSDPATAEVLRRFTRDRLLTADEQTVEVAHEALLREWPRLRTWLAEDAQGRELRVHITGAARTWQQHGEEDSDLYRGARLSFAMDWAALHGRQLNDLERRFLTASRLRTERDAEQQRRANRRLRGLLVGVAIFLVVALLAGSVALVQRGRARASARLAEASATRALAQSVGANGFAQPQLARALLMAQEGVKLAPSDATRGMLLSTLLRAPDVLHTYTTPETERPLQAAPVDAGRIVAVGMNSEDIDFYDVATAGRIGVHPSGAGGSIICCEPGPGSDAIAVIQQTPNLLVPEVLDPHTGKTVRMFSNDPYLSAEAAQGELYSYSIAESRDGRSLYLAYSTGNDPGPQTVGEPSWIDRWAIATGRLAEHSAQGRGTVIGLDVTNHGTGLWLSTDLGGERLDPSTLRVRRTVPYRTTGWTGATNADGTMAIVPSRQFGVVEFVDLRTGASRVGVGAPRTQVQFVAFSPTDPDLAVSVGDDGDLVRWDARNALARVALPIHASRVTDSTFLPDGSAVFTASLDGTAAETGLTGHRGFGSSYTLANFGPAKIQQLLSTGSPPAVAAGTARSAVSLGNDSVTVVDDATGALERFAAAPAGSHVVSMAIAPDDRTLAVAAESPDFASGTVRLWDISRVPRLQRDLPLDVSDRSVNAVAFADAGHEVIAATGYIPIHGSIRGGYLVGWNRDDGSPAFTPVRFPHRAILQLAISPSGRLAALGLLGAENSAVQLVEFPEVRSMGSPAVMPGGLSALGFASDGSLITGDFNGSAQRWSAPGVKPIGKPVLTGGGPVESVAPEPHAPYYLTTNFDGTTRLWDLGSGQEVGSSLTPQLNTATAASVTDDGSSVSIVSPLGTVWLFPLSPQEWSRDACTVAGRNLTPTEWREFVGNRPYENVCSQPAPTNS